MARTIYGGTSADYATAPGGRIVPGATYEAYTAKTGGSRITDLLDADGNAASLVTASSTGLIYYSGPDGDKDPHWLQPTAGGERTAVVPLDNIGETGLTPSISIGTVSTGTAAATLTGTDEEPVLNLTLPSAGVNGVNTAAIQDGAVTTDKIAAKAVTAAKLADDTITAAQIAANAVGSSELADNAVDTASIADSAVTSAKIADGTIVDADISATAAIAVSKVAGAYGAKTTDYTITSADSVIAADTTSGAMTLTLPAASGMTGKALRIVKTGGANTLTITRAGSDTISPSSGSRTSVAFPAATHGEMVLVSSGTGWHVASGQASDETVGRRLWKWEQALAATSTTAGVGWQMIYGDTGLRDISASLANSWAGTLYVQRIGSRVTYTGTSLDKTSASSDVFLTMTTGFTPPLSNLNVGLGMDTTNLTFVAVYVSGSTTFAARRSQMTGQVRLRIEFETAAAWPASLPGSASGSIPTGA